MDYGFQRVMAWQKAHLGYIDKQRFIELKELSEYVSRMINSYCSGIVKNSALKDNEI